MARIKSARVRLALVVICVYFFLLSIAIMGAAFKGFGKEFAENLINSTANPCVGLLIGILATSLVQSSSTTTSIVVGMVASDVLTVSNAIPIIMGANIGTTVTNTIVSFGHITRRDEFKRAIGGATVHDFFNFICVVIMFPLEMMTGFLERSATFMATTFKGAGGFKFTSPIKTVTKPVVQGLKDLLLDTLSFSPTVSYVIMLVISAAILFFALYFIVRLMKVLVVTRAERVLDQTIGRHPLAGIFVGFIFTVFVQSSSITTSLLVPLVGAGLLTLESIFPMVLGANVGTTTTAILASFATGDISAITIAFVHFMFNATGTIIMYPIKIFRKIPIALARGLGEMAYKRRSLALVYVITIYFIVPCLLIFLSNMLSK